MSELIKGEAPVSFSGNIKSKVLREGKNNMIQKDLKKFYHQMQDLSYHLFLETRNKLFQRAAESYTQNMMEKKQN
jgi:hypothetical protein